MTDLNLHLKPFQDPTLDADYIAHLVGVQARENETFHRRLWNYYRNPMLPAIGPASRAMNEHSKPYFLAQEVGLPARITGVQRIGGKQRDQQEERRCLHASVPPASLS